MACPERLAGETFSRLLELHAARTPIPGGGAAAGLVGALGLALGAMALRFSLPKEGNPELAALGDSWEEAARRLAAAADEDCRAYGAVMAALALPKGTEAEKAARQEALRLATMGALASPLAFLRQLHRYAGELAGQAGGVKAALESDLASAAWCLRAAAEMAWQNVGTNARSLPGVEAAAAAAAEAARLREEVRVRAEEILARVRS